MLKKWFISAFPEIEKISQTLAPKLCQKLWINWTFNERVHPILKISQKRFSHFCKILRCWRSDSWSAFPEIEKISQNRGPKFRPKIIINWIFEWKGASDPENRTEEFFVFSARYYDAEEMIHKSISPQLRKYLKIWATKSRPKIIKNWKFEWKGASDPQNLSEPLSLFCKILRCWRSDS